MERSCFDFDMKRAVGGFGTVEAEKRKFLVDGANFVAARIGDGKP